MARTPMKTLDSHYGPRLRVTAWTWSNSWSKAELVEVMMNARKNKIGDGAGGYLEACALGDAQSVRRFLGQGFDPNKFQKQLNYTPLSLAAQRKHIEVVRVLLEHKASVNSNG